MRVRGSGRRARRRAEVIGNPVAHDQVGRRPVQLRIEFSRHPFDHDHCFLQPWIGSAIARLARAKSDPIDAHFRRSGKANSVGGRLP
jgi:hypothetical protein